MPSNIAGIVDCNKVQCWRIFNTMVAIGSTFGKRQRYSMASGRNFKIYTIKNEDKNDIVVSERSYSNNQKNFFTLVTGENGCGKSSLLTKAVNAFIFKGNKYNVKTAHDSVENPSRVIAICNSRYNRFPLRDTFIKKKENKDVNYYAQVNHNMEIGASVLSTVSQCLREIIKRPVVENAIRLNAVRSAYEMIGINPLLLIKFRLDEEALHCYEMFLENPNTYNDKAGLHDFKDFYGTFLTENAGKSFSLNSLRNILTRRSLSDLPPIHFNIEKKYIALHGLNEDVEDIIRSALLLGLIVPNEVQVQRVRESRWISNHHLSSGQQTLLTTALILDAFTTDNCLICIDEPENSLHPAWQLDFMRFVDQLCRWSKGCHFLIATHSPQIISGLNSDNGCIVTLKHNNHRVSLREKYLSTFNENKSFSNEFQSFHDVDLYRKQSADRQLAEIFDSPGFRNDYVIHRLLMILSRMVKGVNPNKNDVPFVDKIEELIKNKHVDAFDPVHVIFQQIKSFENMNKKGGHND